MPRTGSQKKNQENKMVSDDTVRFVFLCLITPIALAFLSGLLASVAAIFGGLCSMVKEVSPIFTAVSKQAIYAQAASRQTVQEKIVYKPVRQIVYRDRPAPSKAANTDKTTKATKTANTEKTAKKATFSEVEKDVVSILRSLKISATDARTLVRDITNKCEYSDVDSLLNVCMAAIKGR